MRFRLIDQVLERAADRVVAVKCVTAAEEYLDDHFPGFPLLPGVMMLEVLVQAGRELVGGADAAETRPGTPATCGLKPLVLTEVRNVRYSNMVRPGESLRVEVTLRKQDEGGWDLEGVGSVNNQTAVQGRFRLEPLTIGD